mmetsp:Transcript_15463/g.64216  ORF Transcript_15463/g.64216 Transcript_15463/m.64216 type:complete len:283 (+) Transcript_15463:2737-3585(+)
MIELLVAKHHGKEDAGVGELAAIERHAPVVVAALRRVGEHLVRVPDLLERFGIPSLVRVVLASELVVGLLELRRRRVGDHAEGVVQLRVRDFFGGLILRCVRGRRCDPGNGGAHMSILLFLLSQISAHLAEVDRRLAMQVVVRHQRCDGRRSVHRADHDLAAADADPHRRESHQADRARGEAGRRTHGAVLDRPGDRRGEEGHHARSSAARAERHALADSGESVLRVGQRRQRALRQHALEPNVHSRARLRRRVIRSGGASRLPRLLGALRLRHGPPPLALQ